METGRIFFAKHLSYCPFSAAIDVAEAYMNAHPEIEIHARRIEDPTDLVRKHEALEFSWTPHTPLLPEIRGLLTVRPHGPPGCELQVTCWYNSRYDEAIGQIVAQTMTYRLLSEITKSADARWHPRETHA